jgi:hypothetical protein
VYLAPRFAIAIAAQTKQEAKLRLLTNTKSHHFVLHGAGVRESVPTSALGYGA